MEEFLAGAGVDAKKFIGKSAHLLLKKYAEIIGETAEKGTVRGSLKATKKSKNIPRSIGFRRKKSEPHL